MEVRINGLNPEELFEHKSLTGRYRTRAWNSCRGIELIMSVMHCRDSVDRLEPGQMADTRINKLAVTEEEHTFSRAGADVEPPARASFRKRGNELQYSERFFFVHHHRSGLSSTTVQ